MSAAPPSFHEPNQIAQGQTISFTRKLWKYLASNGWSLTYSLRGNGQSIEFISTVNADGMSHDVIVPAAVTELWLPAPYQLEGRAINTDGTVEQFYLNNFTVTPDLSTSAPDVDLRTHAQKMLESVEAQLEQCVKNILVDTTVEGTRILREKKNELLQFRQKYFQERQGEIAREAAKNGRPNPRKIRTVLSITAPATIALRQFGAGCSVYDNNWP